MFKKFNRFLQVKIKHYEVGCGGDIVMRCNQMGDTIYVYIYYVNMWYI